MRLEKFFFKELHQSTNRKPIDRVTLDKPHCMKIAKEFGFDFWDGDRKYGYGGYKYIPGRFSFIAQSLIDVYSLSNKSKILDVGCGKGFLLHEIKKILPEIEVYGFDISDYAIDHLHPELKGDFLVHDASKPFPYQDNFFDLTISAATLHNLRLNGLKNALCEIERVSKASYIMVEGYRNEVELFNLECWALTAESFFHYDEWIWIFENFGYSGDYEFIYF